MKIFSLPFKVAKEVVKRNTKDNRRLTSHRADGGNNIFYLGSETLFFEKLNNRNLINRLKSVQALLNNSTRKPKAIQFDEGVAAQHKVKKADLLNLLPFLSSFLAEYSDSYHNPNLDEKRVKKELIAIDDDYLIFESDVVFIHDNNGMKPYFKWFNKKPTLNNWKLFQEFLIPDLSFLNFDYVAYNNETMEFVWEISYAPAVIYSSNNIEEIVSNSVNQLVTNEEDRETIKEAITKIRIGQSQFRNNLIKSSRNKCVFTGIDDPKLLIASHIKPWKHSENNERKDLNNGLLLTPTFDKLFDRFLITFNEDGELLWSKKRLTPDIIKNLEQGITTAQVKVIIDINNKEYFEFHRKRFSYLEEN